MAFLLAALRVRVRHPPAPARPAHLPGPRPRSRGSSSAGRRRPTSTPRCWRSCRRPWCCSRCLGIGAIWQRRLRWEAAIAGIALVLALGYSDLLAYRNATVAPMDRLEELATMGDKFEGQGPMLLNEFEEYAKFFARKAEPVDPYEAWTPASAALLTPALGIYAKAYPLDELQPRVHPELPADRGATVARRVTPAGQLQARVGGRVLRGVEADGPVADHRSPPAGHVRTCSDPASAAATPPCSRVKALGRDSALVGAERPRATIVAVRERRPGLAGRSREPARHDRQRPRRAAARDRADRRGGPPPDLAARLASRAAAS